MLDNTSCQAYQLLEHLVSRKIIPTRWASLWHELEKKKKRLMVNDTERIISSSASSFRKSHDMDYKNICKLIELLQSNEDGKSRKYLLFGEYTSPVLKGWMDVRSEYEKSNLFLVETSLRLKQRIREIRALSDNIKDSKSALLGCAARAMDNAESMHKWETALQNAIAEYGEDFGYGIRNHFWKIKEKEREALTRTLESTSAILENYNDLTDNDLTLDHAELDLCVLTIKELFYYHKVKDSPELQLLSMARESLTQWVSSDGEKRMENEILRLKNIQQNLLENRVGKKINANEAKLRESIEADSQSIGALRHGLSCQIVDAEAQIRSFASLKIQYIDA